MTTTLQDIAPSKLKAHPGNPRVDVGDVTELAASIKDKGIIEPLIVAPNTPSNFVLIAGHRRLAAARVANLKTVPCLVREDLTDPAEQLETMLVENLQRTDLTAIEEAAAYQALLEFPGYTIKKITATTGRSTATVKGRLALAKLPDKARQAIHAGQVSLHDALAVTEFARDADATARLTKALGTHEFKFQLQRAKDKRDRERRTAASDKQLRAELADAKIARHLELPPAYSAGVLRIPGGKVEAHADCGELVGWVDYRGDIEYGCTEPHACQATPTGGISPVAAAERARFDKERREREALEVELRTAATVRRAWLAEVVQRGEPTIARDVITRIVEYLAVEVAPDVAGEVLDLPGLPDDLVAARAVRVLERLGKFDLAQLATGLDVLLFSSDEACLERGNEWGGIHTYGDGTKAWRHRLGTVYGYEWSAVELEQLAKYEHAQGDVDEREKRNLVIGEHELAEAAIRDDDEDQT